MNSGVNSTFATQVCLRCKTQKRKCDKIIPACSLCKRLGRKCVYDTQTSQPMASTPSAEPSRPRSAFPSGSSSKVPVFSESYLRTAIIQQISGKTMKDTFASYQEGIHSWFPIVSSPHLDARLPLNWGESTSEMILLLASMALVTTIPLSSISQVWKESQGVYYLCKSFLGFLDALGKNSLDLLQARVLLVVFEVGHGLYPTSYISIGGLVRAADALEVYPDPKAQSLRGQSREEYALELKRLWQGILILDRYHYCSLFVKESSHLHRIIALENSDWSAVTKFRSFTQLNIPQVPQDNLTPDPGLSIFDKTFAASNFLEKVQNNISSQDQQAKNNKKFTFEEISLITQRIMVTEQDDSLELYDGSWAIITRSSSFHKPMKYSRISDKIPCSALLALYERGIKVPQDEESNNVPAQKLAQIYLDNLLHKTTIFIGSLTAVERTKSLHFASPFVLHMLYKSASILTERIRVGDSSKASLDALRIHRKMLKSLSERWLAAGKFLTK
ncbi:hypothetical protein HYFRA_00006547 [Hymenoscyphus fraxineus]|uniref:Zn(2)-C6 fungal-type domain-containing protein n=1 Tax=Hymenoscyphus fraxineus TaxID=746836 RepID=A0A9N9PHX7_9HELO|nr:hypothetical protein HYFRA_00006547 [Hymenoscyphus fraxineus]